MAAIESHQIIRTIEQIVFKETNSGKTPEQAVSTANTVVENMGTAIKEIETAYADNPAVALDKSLIFQYMSMAMLNLVLSKNIDYEPALATAKSLITSIIDTTGTLVISLNT